MEDEKANALAGLLHQLLSGSDFDFDPEELQFFSRLIEKRGEQASSYAILTGLIAGIVTSRAVGRSDTAITILAEITRNASQTPRSATAAFVPDAFHSWAQQSDASPVARAATPFRPDLVRDGNRPWVPHVEPQGGVPHKPGPLNPEGPQGPPLVAGPHDPGGPWDPEGGGPHRPSGPLGPWDPGSPQGPPLVAGPHNPGDPWDPEGGGPHRPSGPLGPWDPGSPQGPPLVAGPFHPGNPWDPHAGPKDPEGPGRPEPIPPGPPSDPKGPQPIPPGPPSDPKGPQPIPPGPPSDPKGPQPTPPGPPSDPKGPQPIPPGPPSDPKGPQPIPPGPPSDPKGPQPIPPGPPSDPKGPQPLPPGPPRDPHGPQYNPQAPTGVGIPFPGDVFQFVTFEEFLAPAQLQMVTEFVRRNVSRFKPSSVVQRGNNNGVVDQNQRRSVIMDHPDEVETLFRDNVRRLLPEVARRFSLPNLAFDTIDVQITATNDGEFFVAHQDNGGSHFKSRLLSYVYFFHREPKPFSGGELRLYEPPESAARLKAAPRQSTITPHRNGIVFFPSGLLHEIRPVEAPSKKFDDSRFTVNGWIHVKG